MNHAFSAHIALLARDYSAGLDFARHATVVGPAFWIGYFQLAWAHERLGNTELALEALKDTETFSGGNSKMISLRGYILATTGRRDEAAEVLSTLEAMAHERYVPPYAFALICAGLEQRDRALEWLEHAYTARDVHLIWLPMDARVGRIPSGACVRRTHRTLRVDPKHTDAINLICRRHQPEPSDPGRGRQPLLRIYHDDTTITKVTKVTKVITTMKPGYPVSSCRRGFLCLAPLAQIENNGGRSAWGSS
jgi:hypothetical protein